MAEHKFPYEWYLKDGYPAKGIEYHGKKVFGTFICGGGSSMGYKLAGYEHLGGVEIDPKIAKVYQSNHSPKHLYVEDIREFNKRDDLPDELYDLDLLDGSPPCSSFSMAGNREADWNKEKVFAEGQAEQRLDDLVFEYVNTIKKIQPKVAILENVKGLIQGNAKIYAKQIQKQFTDSGYKVQVFLLNAASMGVPQKRERVFFIGLRNDFDLRELELEFFEKPFLYEDVYDKNLGKPITGDKLKYWELCKPGSALSTVHEKGNYFGSHKLSYKKVVNTIMASAGEAYLHPEKPNHISTSQLCKIGSYPLDYDFLDITPQYLMGMSVPSVMTAQISHQIYLQWLSKI